MFLNNLNQETNSNNEVVVNDGKLEDLLDTSSLAEPQPPKKPHQLNSNEKIFMENLVWSLRNLDWDRRVYVAKSLFRQVLVELMSDRPNHELWGMVQSSVDHTNGLLQIILNQDGESFMSKVKAENREMREKLNLIRSQFDA